MPKAMLPRRLSTSAMACAATCFSSTARATTTFTTRAPRKLINRLIELGKPFDFMEYPNRSHSISEGKGTSLHLYNLLGRYIEEHLQAGPR